ncbi:MAG: M16 family metallopeptidase [Deltaproteobacteria bacterium]
MISTPPKLTEPARFKLPAYEKLHLDNGIPVSILQADDPDVVKMEIVFDAGRYFESDRAVAKVTASTIKEGAGTMSSAQIAEKIDYYGANLSTGADMDTAFIQTHFLGKYFEEILRIVRNIIIDPTFTDQEIQKYKTRQIERLKNDLAKNEILAYRYFTEHLFGQDHPYGYSTKPEDYSKVDRQMVVSHYNDRFIANNCRILITGNISGERLELLNNFLGKEIKINTQLQQKEDIPVTVSPGRFRYENDRMYQTAIRIGKRMFNRHHSDYPAMYLLNTILGGYFGARLSSNIREDKGYTYGIYSAMDMMRRDGYFVVSTDVGNEYLESTIYEIYKELEKLRNELVPEDELKLVRNYIKGYMLSMINGNINTLSLIKTIELSQLDRDYFTWFVDKISEVTPDQLLVIANNHLPADEITEVLVGSFK